MTFLNIPSNTEWVELSQIQLINQDQCKTCFFNIMLSKKSLVSSRVEIKLRFGLEQKFAKSRQYILNLLL